MLKIKNWRKFQHFKNRTPPWIKVYRDLLNDLDWFSLDDKSARCLIMLWLIASEDKNKDGELPSIEALSFRLRMSIKDVNACIQRLNKWVLQDDIKMISSGYQDGPPETETEREREGEIDCAFRADIKKSFKQLTKEDFKEQCQTLSEGILDEEDAIAFFRYWIEPNTKGKMRFQLQQTWDTKLRMATWRRNKEEREAKNVRNG